MTAAAIARVVAREGEPVLLRRQVPVTTVPTPFGTLAWGVFPWDGNDGFDNAAARAVVQDYSPAELVGGVRQGDRRVILSDAEIARLGWPGPPRHGDWIEIRDRTWVVQGCDTREFRGQSALHIMQVRGG